MTTEKHSIDRYELDQLALFQCSLYQWLVSTKDSLEDQATQDELIRVYTQLDPILCKHHLEPGARWADLLPGTHRLNRFNDRMTHASVDGPDDDETPQGRAAIFTAAIKEFSRAHAQDKIESMRLSFPQIRAELEKEMLYMAQATREDQVDENDPFRLKYSENLGLFYERLAPVIADTSCEYALSDMSTMRTLHNLAALATLQQVGTDIPKHIYETWLNQRENALPIDFDESIEDALSKFQEAMVACSLKNGGNRSNVELRFINKLMRDVLRDEMKIEDVIPYNYYQTLVKQSADAVQERQH